MRMSRWRPVCPECGYSLRGCRSERCPECGVAFPTTARFFRRWANRRLTWDRQRRGGLIFSYAETIVTLVVMPWKAGRGLAIPDHQGRAIRWAAFHLIIAALIGAALGSQGFFTYRIESEFRDSPWSHPAGFTSTPAPWSRVATWFAESTLAWVVALASIVALGLFLSVALPRRHLAAKRGGVKVSLYLTVLGPLAIGGWYAYKAVRPDTLEHPIVGFSLPVPALPPEVSLIAYWYGAWWACAVAWNPLERWRGIWQSVLYATLFMGLWWLAAHNLFPMKELRCLL
ncbi:MAG: hypothetical protein JSU68_01850 [Phycisphaerales bacterium]|nr:MAG: hypothetical protein JSU68_01850 [Phycisphaerales bacterium]